MSQRREELRARAQVLRQRAALIGNGFKELGRGLREGAQDVRESAIEANRDLRAWLAEPRTLEERLADTRAFQKRSRVKARQMSARSYDQARVYTAATRVQTYQGQLPQRMTYAPFTLNNHEAAAGEVLCLLEPARRAELVPIAERIRDAQLSMLAKTRSYPDCGLCDRYFEHEVGGQCCSGWVGQWFRPIDGVFRRLLGERAPVWPRFNRDWSRCGYMGERGCLLPAGTRPIICVGFYCDDFRKRLTADGVWQDMGEDFTAIREALRQLEFRFSMHRRFLAGSGATIQGGSMGYLWNKLMGLYASFDQVTADRPTAGVDAISGESIGGGSVDPEKDPGEAASDLAEVVSAIVGTPSDPVAGASDPVAGASDPVETPSEAAVEGGGGK